MNTTIDLKTAKTIEAMNQKINHMLVASILCGMLCTTIFLPMPHRILMPMFPLSIPLSHLAFLVLPERFFLTVQSM